MRSHAPLGNEENEEMGMRRKISPGGSDGIGDLKLVMMGTIYSGGSDGIGDRD